MYDTFFDGEEFFCEFCADSSAYEISDTETDAPMHCTNCQRPLTYSLTPEGVEYVIELVKKELSQGKRLYLEPILEEGNYYNNCPHFYIVRDWTQEILNYLSLSDEDKNFLNKAISHMEYQEKENKNGKSKSTLTTS